MIRFLLIGVILSAPVFGQIRLGPGEAVARAIASHPLLEAGERQVAVAEGIRRQAGMAPNPVFLFQHENIRSSPDSLIPYWSWTDTFAYLRQPLETGGKRARRKEAADFEVRRAELRREWLRKQIAARVKQAYWDAAGANRVHSLLVESANNFLRTVEYHEIRVREGAMAEADLLRIRLESERLNLAAANALLEAERARIRLFREMGQADIPDQIEFETLAPAGEPSQVADPRQALEERAEMKLARMEVEAAQAELRLAQAKSKPDAGVIAGYKRTAGYNTLLAGVEFGLPFFDRNQGSISAAAARIDAYRSEASSMAAMVRAEVAAAQKARELRWRQIADSLGPMRRQAEESAEIAQAAYREGGADLLRLLDAERLRIETETLYHEALAAYRRSEAELESAMGVEP